MRKFDKVLSVKMTVQTEKLLERMYLKIFTERLNDNLRKITKAEAFGDLIKKLAATELEGIEDRCR